MAAATRCSISRRWLSRGRSILAQFPQGIIDTGKIGDQIYMITLGNSAPGIHFRTDLFDEAGVDYPHL